MDNQPFDVVIVSDFSKPCSSRFETLTLFFLASWLEFGGLSRDFPLHVVCIGEPPESVRILGERCNAKITSHPPLLFGGFANKLRGFEVSRETDHLLLLDSDVLILSDISDLSTEIGDSCIAAAASNEPGPWRRSSKDWREIHELLGLPCPEGHTTPLNLELDTYRCRRYKNCDRSDLAPYYNGGIVYAPWDSRLGDVWRDHLIRIHEVDASITGPKGLVSNQPSLATAIHERRLAGVHFRLLPREYHIRWQHIAAGAVTAREVKLFHSIGFGRGNHPTYESTAKSDIEIFRTNTMHQTRKLRSHRSLLTWFRHFRNRHVRAQEWSRIYDSMELLYDKYVRDLKE